MKLKNLILGVGAVGLLFSCSQEKTYRITPTSMEGIEIGDTLKLRNYATGESIDSLVVNDSTTFVFEGTLTESVPAALTQNGRRVAAFVLEPGELKFDAAKKSITGTSLNDTDSKVMLFVDSLYKNIKEQTKALAELPEKEGMEKLSALYMKAQDLRDSTYQKVFRDNKTNPLGYIYFVELVGGCETVSEINEMLQGTPEWFKETKAVKSFISEAENREMTSVGKKFVDFEVTTSEGKTVKLSDYVGKGKYVLVDFWASWCGPCRREIPNLKVISQKHKDLVVLGVAVWDKPEDTKVAVEQLEIKWDVIDNAQQEPAKLYGINGIPCIILFGPDGTILSRNLQGEELAAAVDKALAK